MKLMAIIFPVFARKAFSKKELLIMKCFNSEKEAEFHAQETVDKNAHTKTAKWVPAAVADWVSFWERSRFQPLLFSGFSTRSCFDILCQITWD